MKPFFFFGGLFGIVLSSHAVFADADDSLTVSAGLNWTQDDNLFRVEEGRAPFGQAFADSWLTSLVSLNFDRYYGQQRVQADVRLSNVSFDKYRELSYNGKDIRLAWSWKAGPHWEGLLDTSYLYILAPYTDFESSERNIQTLRRHSFKLNHKLHPSWFVGAALIKDVQKYEALSRRLNDRTDERVEVSGNFIPRSGNEIGIVAHTVDGHYPLTGSVLIPNASGFREKGLKLRLNWTITAHTKVDAIVGWARRSQTSDTSRTASGSNGKINVQYERNKIKFDTSLWRSFVPFDGAINDFTTNTGASVSAQWSPTSKFQSVLSTSYEKRDFDPRAFLSQFSRPSDSLRQIALSASYKYSRNVTLSAGFIQNRSSGPNTSIDRRSRSNSFQISGLVAF